MSKHLDWKQYTLYNMWQLWWRNKQQSKMFILWSKCIVKHPSNNKIITSFNEVGCKTKLVVLKTLSCIGHCCYCICLHYTDIIKTKWSEEVHIGTTYHCHGSAYNYYDSTHVDHLLHYSTCEKLDKSRPSRDRTCRHHLTTMSSVCWVILSKIVYCTFESLPKDGNYAVFQGSWLLQQYPWGKWSTLTG